MRPLTIGVVAVALVITACRRSRDRVEPVTSIPACKGIAGIDEECLLVTDSTGCVANKCAKLVVVFSGGEQGCARKPYGDVLAGYAANGWAAVCVNAFETAEGAGSVPYADEAPRYDRAMREAIAWARPFWTGEDLLLQGISHGASAPLIAIARTDLEQAPHWRGTRRTAACFLDGTYDQHASAEHLRTGHHSRLAPSECRRPVPYRRWLERYCRGSSSTCDLRREPAAVRDTIVDAPLAGFGIRAYRLVECGSAMPICAIDILPAAPIEALCKHLDASPDHTCTFVSLPRASHLTCHRTHGDDCRTWFDELP